MILGSPGSATFKLACLIWLIAGLCKFSGHRPGALRRSRTSAVSRGHPPAKAGTSAAVALTQARWQAGRPDRLADRGVIGPRPSFSQPPLNQAAGSSWGDVQRPPNLQSQDPCDSGPPERDTGLTLAGSCCASESDDLHDTAQ